MLGSGPVIRRSAAAAPRRPGRDVLPPPPGRPGWRTRPRRTSRSRRHLPIRPVRALDDRLAYPLTKGSRVTRSGPHSDHVLAGWTAREAPPMAAIDLLHHPPGGLGEPERGLDVLLRMTPSQGHPARLGASHDNHGGAPLRLAAS